MRKKLQWNNWGKSKGRTRTVNVCGALEGNLVKRVLRSHSSPISHVYSHLAEKDAVGVIKLQQSGRGEVVKPT